MKDKETIAYKNERIKNIAFNLRKLHTKVVMQEWSRLGEKQKNKSTVEYIKIENERSDLRRALDASVCLCPGCHQTDREMVYNAFLEEWYCTCCVQEYIDFYYEKNQIAEQDGKDFYESFL